MSDKGFLLLEMFEVPVRANNALAFPFDRGRCVINTDYNRGFSCVQSSL